MSAPVFPACQASPRTCAYRANVGLSNRAGRTTIFPLSTPERVFSERSDSGPSLSLTNVCLRKVWGSIRDWDNLSRGILVGYLQAASAITRKSQGRPGVAVRVSLAAGRDGDNGAEKQGGRDKDGCVPWALTTGGGGDDPGVVELARPGHLRMRLPISAIQRVQVVRGRDGGLAVYCRAL